MEKTGIFINSEELKRVLENIGEIYLRPVSADGPGSLVDELAAKYDVAGAACINIKTGEFYIDHCG